MAETPSYPSEEQLNEAREAFALFDKESAGSIRTVDLGLVLRSLGFTISTTELAAMEKDADPDELRFVKLPDFLRQVTTAVMLSKASNLSAKKALKGLGSSVEILLDKKTKKSATGDSISVAHLRHLLTRMGDRMSVEEFGEFCREIESEKSRVKMDSLINFLVV